MVIYVSYMYICTLQYVTYMPFRNLYHAQFANQTGKDMKHYLLGGGG